MPRQCVDPQCSKQSHYGLPGERATRCAEHQLANMIDIVTKRCTDPSCTVQPVFAPPGKRATHCAAHKLAGMIDVKNRRCAVPDCTKQPVFGFPGQRALRCSEHQLARMVDVSNPCCASCNLTQVQRQGDSCAPCGEFQELGTSRKTRRREMAAIAALKEAGILKVDNVRVFEITYNKSVGKSCGAYRPDIVIDCGTFVIVIEIDEHQHLARTFSRVVESVNVTTTHVNAAYAPDCELVRMLNVTQAYQKPCHFIRFNPDAFEIGGVNVRVSVADRHVALCTQIHATIASGVHMPVVVTYMFYDDAIQRTETPDLPAGF